MAYFLLPLVLFCLHNSTINRNRSIGNKIRSITRIALWIISTWHWLPKYCSLSFRLICLQSAFTFESKNIICICQLDTTLFLFGVISKTTNKMIFSKQPKLFSLLLVILFVEGSIGGSIVEVCRNKQTCFTENQSFSMRTCKCECQMGFEEVFNINNSTTALKCEQHACSSTDKKSCEKWDNSECSAVRDSCQCQEGYQLDSGRIYCTPKIDSVPNIRPDGENQLKTRNCSEPTDCGSNTFCFSGTCKCNTGFVADANGLDCMPKKCQLNEDCKQFEHSTCEFGVCQCAPFYKLNNHSQACQLDVQKAPSCSNNGICGKNAACLYGTCRCNLGFTSPWTEGWSSCLPVQCTKQSQCTSLFNSTRCNLATNRCVCDIEMTLDFERQRCVPETTAPTTVKARTRPPTTESSLCSLDSDCPQTFECNRNKCECPREKYLDPEDNICRTIFHPDNKHHGHSNVGLIVGLSVGGVALLVGIIIALLCIFRKKAVLASSNATPARPPIVIDSGDRVASPSSTQPSAPSITPPTMRTTLPYSAAYQIPQQPSFNPTFGAPLPPNAAPQTYAAVNATNDASRMYPTLPKQWIIYKPC